MVTARRLAAVEDAAAALALANVVEGAGVVVAADLVSRRQVEQAFVRLVTCLGQDQHAVVAEGEIGAAVAVALTRITVVNAHLQVGFVDRFDPGANAPGRLRVGGDALGHIEERRRRLPTDGVAHELTVKGRGQEVVGRRQAPVGKVELAVEQVVVHLDLDQPPDLTAAVELLHAESVADVPVAEAVARTLRAADTELRVRQVDQLLQVEIQLQQDVVDIGGALAVAAHRVSHELHGVAEGHFEPFVGERVAQSSPVSGEIGLRGVFRRRLLWGGNGGLGNAGARLQWRGDRVGSLRCGEILSRGWRRRGAEQADRG